MFEWILTKVMITTTWFVINCRDKTDLVALNKVKGLSDMMDREIIKEIENRKRLKAAALQGRTGPTGSSTSRQPVSGSSNANESVPQKRTVASAMGRNANVPPVKNIGMSKGLNSGSEQPNSARSLNKNTSSSNLT